MMRIRTARGRTVTRMNRRHKAFSKVVRGLWQFLAGLYELRYDEDAPSLKDLLRG